MKKLLLLGACFALTLSLSAQDGIVRYFEKYMDSEDFTVVYFSPKMFSMVGKLAAEDEDIEEVKEVIRDLKGLRILTTENNAAKYYDEATRAFDKSDYEVLMTVRSEEDNVNFYVKDSNGGDIVDELLLIVNSDDEFVLLSLVGKIDLNKISKLSESVQVKGMEHLKKMQDEQ